MADSNIKKVTILKSELPPVDSTNLQYNIRYRIVSEDKNRVSHWSRIYNIASTPPVPLTDYAITTDNVTRVISLIWNPASNVTETSFDLYIKWVGQSGTEANYNYQYVTTTSNNSYSTIHPIHLVDPFNPLLETNTKKVRILVQRATYPKEISASALLFETALTTI